ncbi:MAG TPA: GntR family transcriptional regulator [Pararobbsia sp.]|jgi:GntR family transcriptional regulator|nr:GntR family transcriptional regulator [Pararobbsia sp.]
MSKLNGGALAASPVPLYTQIKDRLRGSILDGSYPTHSQLPSESELGAMFDVSRITVRQALGDLQKEGLIFRIHGKGTFVAKPKAFQNVTSLQGFAEAMTSMGHEIVNRVTDKAVVEADSQVARQLALEPGSRVVRIERIRLLNREPVSLETTWLPLEPGRRVLGADLATRDIFLILENDCGITLEHADVRIDAMLADPPLSISLNVAVGSPVLRIERLSHTSEGRPIDYETLCFRGDAFQYRLRAERKRTRSAVKTRHVID